ncbi:carboxylesterase [Thecamonas trahens ATCC 50062]|uniref:Carboxylesterase n=1 Tax=Thecamonas trahens ATCC 50062 TaxID=461836 RepID=A0A0L0DN96_THETB|nr:carboxylesterase [Thecamonas trahens ATCC 50062]KNC53491.1 carboxylesterase [Thecamonas trahens ATCC 50062]|eukprot:XP_013761813.1 carboxylesterase [Thecamonas trahens ATCC 50062]
MLRTFATLTAKAARQGSTLARKVLEPAGEHKATIVWLHGLGDSPDGFAPLFQATQLFGESKLGEHIRVVLPDAPERPITVNGGMVMPGWYDIASLDRIGADGPEAAEDVEGIAASAQDIIELVAEERALLRSGLDADLANDGQRLPIVLGGFSQGGAMALYAALRAELGLAGLVCWSSYVLAATESVELATASSAASLPPLLIHHGREDPMVPLAWAKPGWDRIRAAWPELSGSDLVEWDGLGHSVDIDQVVALDKWLAHIFPLSRQL